MKKLLELATSFEAYRSGQRFSGNPASLYEPMNYIMDLGGKRIRPALVALAGGSCGKLNDDHVSLAAIIEMIHLATLVHDDIMDGASLRRGRSTLAMRWGYDIAVLVGDCLFAHALKLVVKHPVHTDAVASLFLKTAGEVCDGQQMDMDFERRSDVSEAEYLEMIRLKTAVLLGASIGMGALGAGAEESLAQRLYDFAVAVGLGFQLRDDYLDSFGDPALTGKQPGGDILANKKTWLWIHTFNTGGGEVQKSLLHWKTVQDPARSEEKISAVRELMQQTGADSELLTLSNIYYKLAAEILEATALSIHAAQDLQELLVFLRERSY